MSTDANHSRVTVSQKEYDEVTATKKERLTDEVHLAPFLGQGGKYRSVSEIASLQKYINSDHAPHKAMLSYIDKDTMKNVPKELWSNLKDFEKIKNKRNELRDTFMKNTSVMRTRATSRQLKVKNAEQQKIEEPKSAEESELDGISKELEHCELSLLRQMAVLSIPEDIHYQLPSWYAPKNKIVDLMNENAKAAGKVMGYYNKEWEKALKSGIQIGYIKRNAKNQDEFSPEEVWKENFDDLLACWLQNDSKPKVLQDNLEDVKELHLKYCRKFWATAIYYLKTPKSGYERLISLYIHEYKLFLKDFESYKCGIKDFLDTTKDFGWINEDNVANLITTYNLNSITSDLMSPKWQCVRKLIRGDRGNIVINLGNGKTCTAKQYPELTKDAKNEGDKADQEKAAINTSNEELQPEKVTRPRLVGKTTKRQSSHLNPETKNKSTESMTTTELVTIKNEHTVTNDVITEMRAMLLHIMQDVKDIKEQQAEFKMKLEDNKAKPLARENYVALMPSQVKLPKINNKNQDNIILTFPTGTIYLKDIKTVQPDLSTDDSKTLAESFGVDTEDVNWMVDSVLAGFLFKIADCENQGNIAYTPAEVLLIFNGLDDSQNDLSKFIQILIPYNHQGNHWVLMILKPTTKEILVLDSKFDTKFQLLSEKQKILQDYFNRKVSLPNDTEWSVKYPKAVATEKNECGPFLCFYAEASIRNWSFTEMPDVKFYRNDIISTLVGHCDPGITNKSTQKCYKCKEDVTDNSTCDFCKRKAHRTCLRQIFARGNDYSICI